MAFAQKRDLENQNTFIVLKIFAPRLHMTIETPR